jgi:hypothetical protein
MPCTSRSHGIYILQAPHVCWLCSVHMPCTSRSHGIYVLQAPHVCWLCSVHMPCTSRSHGIYILQAPHVCWLCSVHMPCTSRSHGIYVLQAPHSCWQCLHTCRVRLRHVLLGFLRAPHRCWQMLDVLAMSCARTMYVSPRCPLGFCRREAVGCAGPGFWRGGPILVRPWVRLGRDALLFLHPSIGARPSDHAFETMTHPDKNYPSLL